MSPEELVPFFHARRFPLSDEKLLQVQIDDELTRLGVSFKREVRLSGKDVVDFLIEDKIALEIKIKGGKRAIFRQCERYCSHERVTALVLATAVPMGFPPEILGKPCYVASLGRGWL